MKKLLPIVAMLMLNACSSDISFPAHFRIADSFSVEQREAIGRAAETWNILSEGQSFGQVLINDGAYHQTSRTNDFDNDTLEIFPITSDMHIYGHLLHRFHAQGFDGMTVMGNGHNDILMVTDKIENDAEWAQEDPLFTLEKGVLHEFGHLLGLGHTNILGDLMYGGHCNFRDRPNTITPASEDWFCKKFGCNYKTGELNY